jgi:hypothetical protein
MLRCARFGTILVRCNVTDLVLRPAPRPTGPFGVVWVDLTSTSEEAVPESVSHELRVDVGPRLPVCPLLTSVCGLMT